MNNMKEHNDDGSRGLGFGDSFRQCFARLVPVAFGCALIASAPWASALGLRIPNQDATAIGRGNAFVATADNPSAIYYNPAGITQLEGQHIQGGSLFYLGIYGDYESPTGTTTTHNNAEVIAAPTLQYTYTPESLPLSFGFGIYEPFGFSVDWPNEAPFRQEALNASLAYVTFNPVVAWKIIPSLSIAAGPTINYSQFTEAQGLLQSPIYLPGDQAKFKGEGWSYGFNVGVLWQPHPKWSLGGSYRSSSRMDYQGSFTLHPTPPFFGSYGTSSSIDFPQIAMGGISFRPTKKWNIEFDLDWADWSSVQSLGIEGISTRRLDWKSTFMYEVGVTYYFDNRYFLSAGYFFSPASTSTEYFTPMLPDTDLHIGSLGGGYKGKHWDWAASFQLIAGGWRSVTVDPSLNPAINGQYRLLTPTLSFTVGYHF
jgi:long-chain fatty acid transport protein